MSVGAALLCAAALSAPLQADLPNFRGHKSANEALHRFAYRGNLSGARLALRRGAYVNFKDLSGYTALMRAVQGDRAPLVEFLIDQGADPNLQTAAGMTALMHARSREVLQILLRARANVDKQSTHGRTALMFAAQAGRLDLVKDLVRASANLDLRDRYGHTALLRAAATGHPRVLAFLSGQYARGYVATGRNQAALHLAAAGGHLRCVRYLIRRGVPIDARDQNGVTPLMEAVRNRRLEVAGVLHEYGANVRLRDRAGRTVLMFAGDVPTASLLLQRGARPGAVDLHGNTALMSAVWRGLVPLARFLVQKGVPINAADQDSETALFGAVRYGDEAMLKFLIALPGIELNKRSKSGETPLLLARRLGRARLADLIAARGGGE